MPKTSDPLYMYISKCTKTGTFFMHQCLNDQNTVLDFYEFLELRGKVWKKCDIGQKHH